MNYISIKNNQAIALNKIPELPYADFLKTNVEMLLDKPERHCVNYFGVKSQLLRS